jgi:membrane protein YqaA with SNARE-associated domain
MSSAEARPAFEHQHRSAPPPRPALQMLCRVCKMCFPGEGWETRIGAGIPGDPIPAVRCLLSGVVMMPFDRRSHLLHRLTPLGPWAIVILGLSAGVYQPVGPDVLVISSALIGMKPHWAAALAFVSTCAGSLLGYGIGAGLFKPLLRGLFARRKTTLERAQIWLRRWGFWFVALAGVSPIPLTQVAWAAGFLRMPCLRFLLGVMAGLLPRFGIEALFAKELARYLR